MKDPFAICTTGGSSGKAVPKNEIMLRGPRDFSTNPIMRERDIAQLHHDRLEEERGRLLKALLEQTKMPVTQENGQRRYGPPPDPDTPLPEKGSEVFVGRIPRDCFEPELVPVFEKAGKIYELRLMMDFSGSNRGYCFVCFFTKAEAQRAVRMLNNYEIRKGLALGVVKSVDNCRLLVTCLPRDKDADDIRKEVQKLTSGVIEVIVHPPQKQTDKNRGFAFLEYHNHKTAAMARRKLYPGRMQMWNKDVGVDWAEPEPEGRVLFVRNLQEEHTEEALKLIFNEISGGGVLKIKKMENKDYAFIDFRTPEEAEMAKSTIENCEEYYDLEFQIFWARSKSCRREMPRNKVRVEFGSPARAPTNVQPGFARYQKWNTKESFSSWNIEIGHWNPAEESVPLQASLSKTYSGSTFTSKTSWNTSGSRSYVLDSNNSRQICAYSPKKNVGVENFYNHNQLPYPTYYNDNNGSPRYNNVNRAWPVPCLGKGYPVQKDNTVGWLSRTIHDNLHQYDQPRQPPSSNNPRYGNISPFNDSSGCMWFFN